MSRGLLLTKLTIYWLTATAGSSAQLCLVDGFGLLDHDLDGWRGATYASTFWFATFQEEVPSELLGRVASLDWMLSPGAEPAGEDRGRRRGERGRCPDDPGRRARWR